MRRLSLHLPRFDNRSLRILGMLSILFTGGCEPKDPAAALRRPPGPIIIIDIDTLRAGHLGSYGYERDTSPHLDAFASEAVRFEYAFSQAPNTPPSQASIFTGLYPSTHGFILHEDSLPDEVTTLAEILSAQGYATAGFVDGAYMSSKFNMHQGYAVYSDLGGGLEVLMPQVFEWLDEHHQEETFLLLLHTYDTHTPYDPPEPYRSMFLEGLDPPTPGFEPTAEQLEAVRKAPISDDPSNPVLPPNDLEYAKAIYDGGIRYVDDRMGELFAKLRELDLMDRATIVVLSDHGEEFLEHGSVLHDKLYATVTHIPLMIRWPGGAVISEIPQIVEGLDLMPTLLDLIGLPPPVGISGQSLLPLVGGDTDHRFVAFGESPYFGLRRFIAHGDHRLLLSQEFGQVELYDFRRDPLEQVDLSTSEPDLQRKLRQGLDHWQAAIDRLGTYESGPPQLNDEILEQLKALGYLD